MSLRRRRVQLFSRFSLSSPIRCHPPPHQTLLLIVALYVRNSSSLFVLPLNLRRLINSSGRRTTASTRLRCSITRSRKSDAADRLLISRDRRTRRSCSTCHGAKNGATHDERGRHSGSLSSCVSGTNRAKDPFVTTGEIERKIKLHQKYFSSLTHELVLLLRCLPMKQSANFRPERKRQAFLCLSRLSLLPSSASR